jgi:hypothetical protein
MNQNSKFLMLYCGHKKKGAPNICKKISIKIESPLVYANLEIPSPMFYFHTPTKVLPYFTSKFLGCN